MEPCSHLQGPIRSACPQVAHLLDSSPTDPFSQIRPDSPPGSRPPMPRPFSSPLASVASDHFPSSFIGYEVYTPRRIRRKQEEAWKKRKKEMKKGDLAEALGETLIKKKKNVREREEKKTL